MENGEVILCFMHWIKLIILLVFIELKGSLTQTGVAVRLLWPKGSSGFSGKAEMKAKSEHTGL